MVGWSCFSVWCLVPGHVSWSGHVSWFGLVMFLGWLMVIFLGVVMLSGLASVLGHVPWSGFWAWSCVRVWPAVIRVSWCDNVAWFGLVNSVLAVIANRFNLSNDGSTFWVSSVNRSPRLVIAAC